MFYVLILVAAFGYFFLDYKSYSKSGYFKESKNSYFKTRFNIGLNGEYLTYKALEKTNGDKRILVNIYIPKANGKTTEIDLLMIHETGLYCIESKNYSGWIFGDEKSQYWTQSLKNRQKNKFYNPIMQNNGHIKHLGEHLGSKYDGEIKSVVVFSERCELKKVSFDLEKTMLLKRDSLTGKLNKYMKDRLQILDDEKRSSLYQELKGHSNKSDQEKQAHVDDIKNNKVAKPGV